MRGEIEKQFSLTRASPGTPIRFFLTFPVALALFASVGQCSDITDGLVGYWPFDETNGIVAHEASGNGLNGMLTNFPGGQGNWVAGQIGGALQFGGLSAKQYVHVPDFTKPTTSLTISAWVWADSLPLWATIAANWNGLYGALNYGIFVSDPYLSLYFAEPNDQGINVANGSESDPPITLGEWHHVTVVANASRRGAPRVEFYRDGQPVGFFPYSGSFYPAPVPWLNIGGEPTYDPNEGYWDGKIDDLALWTRALSRSEISNIYTAGLEGRSLLSSTPLPPKPPTITCSGSLTLEGGCAGVVATVSATVQDSTTNSVTVVWTMDGTARSTNNIPPRGLLTPSNFTFSAMFSPGQHVVTISASNGVTPPASCPTTVTARDTTDQVRNGSFEMTDSFGDPIDWASGGWELGWENAPDGRNFAYAPVSQAIYTRPGQSYTLSFYAAGDLYASQTSNVAVDWGGHTVAKFTTQPHGYDPQRNRVLQIVWERFSTTLKAVSSSTALTIRSTDGTWAFLDDVRLVNIPIPPTITCSPPLRLECENGRATGTAVASVQDLGGNSVEVVWLVDGIRYQTNTISPSCALITTNLTFTTEFTLGDHLITASASNGQTTSASCSTAVTVRDTTPPSVTLLGPSTMTNQCHALWIDPGAMATDTCAANLDVITNGAVDPNTVGLYTISYTATDPSGNSTTNTRSVRVVDTTRPIIDCSTDLEVDAQSPSGAVVNFIVTASDGCDASPQVICTPASGSVFPIGETPVSCTAMDAWGNSTNCSFVVKVRSPAEMLTNLIAQVADLPIQHGVKNSLLVKLKNGFSNLAKRKQEVALNLLSAFENEVEAQPGGGLSTAQADELIASATGIIAVLVGQVSPTTDQETTYSGRLSVEHRATSDGQSWILMMNWAGKGVLQSADDPNGDWADVPQAVSPYWSTLDSPGQFFRVRPP
jgi:hypothetical protein